jgi:tetratricopeptide (TPR) repeat protein
MTDAAHPSAAAPASATPAAPSVVVRGGKKGKRSASVRRLWQVPALLVGLVAFGFGVRAISQAIKPVPFEVHERDIKALIEAGQIDKAIGQINKVGNYYTSQKQLATLSMLAGDAYYTATREPPGQVEANYKQMISHYETGRALGVAWTEEVHERVGEAAMETGDAKRALAEMEQVVAEDEEALPRHARQLVAIYRANGESSKAHEVIEKLLALKELELEDRVWGLCARIEMALGVPLEQDKAVAAAKAAVAEIPERNPAGALLAWVGRAEFEAGQVDEARKDLREARARFVTHTTEDGRAALLLGMIAQAKGDHAEAMKNFEEVISSHPGSTIFAAARLGRAEVLAATRQPNETMEKDYLAVIKAILEAPRRAATKRPEMVKMEHVDSSLLTNYQAYQQEDRLDDALKFLMLMKATGEMESAGNVYREATTEEARADQLLAVSRTTKDGKEAAAKLAAAIKLYSDAADAYLRHAELSTLDDRLSGASLWKAGELMDRAGRPKDSLKVFERYSVQRPRDPRGSEALYTMGRLHQSLGELDEAIAAHERNRKENPKSPASYLSTADLARCYMAKGSGFFKQAEEPLLELVQDNPNVLPTAAEFRVAMLTLGELYTRWSEAKDEELGAAEAGMRKIKEGSARGPADAAQMEAQGKVIEESQGEVLKYRALAIMRLEECRLRYVKDPQGFRMTYWLAESYRKSGGDIAGALAREPGIAHAAELEQAREERLLKGASLYQEVVDLLDRGEEAGMRPAAGTVEEAYLRQSHLNRAECFYELGRYEAAIKQYDAVATRYAQTLTAIEAYVQIVRSYRALKEPTQAAAAAERARWILKRIPDEEFGKSTVKVTREYYERVLALGRG